MGRGTWDIYCTAQQKLQCKKDAIPGTSQSSQHTIPLVTQYLSAKQYRWWNLRKNKSYKQVHKWVWGLVGLTRNFVEPVFIDDCNPLPPGGNITAHKDPLPPGGNTHYCS